MPEIIPKRVTRNYKSDGLRVDFDAATLANAMAEAAVEVLTSALEDNTDPESGAPHRPHATRTKAWRAIQEGKRPSARGHTAQAVLLRSFSVRRGRGKRKAKAQVKVGAWFMRNFLAQELRRGEHYVTAEGLVEAAVDEVLATVLENMIDNRPTREWSERRIK